MARASTTGERLARIETLLEVEFKAVREDIADIKLGIEAHDKRLTAHDRQFGAMEKWWGRVLGAGTVIGAAGTAAFQYFRR